MSSWPEYDLERLSGALLRVDMYEARYLAVHEHNNVVNHLLRSASAACLSDREEEANRFIARAASRMAEWVAAVAAGRVNTSTYADFAASRGLLAIAIASGGSAIATAFAEQTAAAPAGPTHNARLVAATMMGDLAAAEASARLCELSDAGLGLPWKKFALALLAKNEDGMRKCLNTWVQEKMEATMTHEWGAYNEVPIEVSGALALAARAGVGFKVDSNRVLTKFRS